jgi:cardiolipin synthase A/B
MAKAQKHSPSTPPDPHPAFETIHLVHGGHDYFDRLHHIIAHAQTELHIQTYIWDEDATGKRVAADLKKAADRGVQVYLLPDGYGASKLSRAFIQDLKDHGIHFRFYAPLFTFSSFYLGRRLHHKIVVADNKTALIGGMNIADKYRGTKKEKAWLDYAIQIEGPVAKYLQDLCRDIYRKKRRRRRKGLHQWLQGPQGTIRFLRNDWLMRRNEVHASYLAAIYHAKEEIIIVATYFLPGSQLREALRKASVNRKVRIRLIVSGKTDVPVIQRATNYLYDWLLRYNMELYEWPKSVLHGKVAVADREWATVGSFNLNPLSSYGSIEMNVEVRSPEFGNTLHLHLEDIIAQCHPVTPRTVKARYRLLNQFANWCAYRFMRAAMIVLTYLSYNRILKRFQNE